MRLARIEEFPEGGHEDERITATIQAIRDRGVRLVFGDLADVPLALPAELWGQKPCRPSRKINLDPTALLGLCSDLLHYPLPTDEDGAKRRYFRPQEHLVPGREGRAGNEGVGSWKGQSQNSRELVKGTLEEMSKPLIEELRDTLGALGEKIEFWATEATVLHVNEALGGPDVVGDGQEKRRMRRMLGYESGDFFEGSRYAGHEGCLKGFRVNVFPSEIKGESSNVSTAPQSAMASPDICIGMGSAGDQWQRSSPKSTWPDHLSPDTGGDIGAIPARVSRITRSARLG